MSAWNKSSRSRFRKRANGLPVISRSDALRKESSEIDRKKHELNVAKKNINFNFTHQRGFRTQCSRFPDYRHVKISLNSVLDV